MTDEHDVDTASLEKLVGFLLAGGVHGLFVLGSTSEVAVLTGTQRATVIDVAVRATGGHVPVFAGVIDTATDRVIEHARVAEKGGVDGLVVTSPFYVRPSQDEVKRHFRMVREAVDLPILAYDIPSAVQTKLDRATVLRLAEEELIVGIKDSSGDDANFRGLVLEMRRHPGFAAFTGSELLVDAAMLIGARGSVPGLGNVDPHGYVRLYNAARACDWVTARAEQERLFGLFSFVRTATDRMGFTASALGAFKTALMLRGVIATNMLGRPLPRYNDEESARVRVRLQEVGLL